MAIKGFWTEEKQQLLEKMWKEGAVARDIAEALGGGITRNAVIGKANRMGLSQQPKEPQDVPCQAEEEAVTILSTKHCQWPFGDPNDNDFHFCGKPAEPDWPYCQDHCNEAYRSLNDKDNDEAVEEEEIGMMATPEAKKPAAGGVSATK